jgi:hypothetical protein
MSANSYPALFEETIESGVFELQMAQSSSALSGSFSLSAPAAHYNNRGPLITETVSAGGRYALQTKSNVVLAGTVDVKGAVDLYSNSSSTLVSTGITAQYLLAGEVNSSSSLTGTAEPYALFANLETSKLSEYTVVREIQDHTEQANENLIMQFKDCPNILNLLSTPLTEVDKTAIDVREIQQFVVNIEEAYGAHLDLLGTILGVARTAGQDDITYRAVLVSQIQTITCDGTLTKILATLLMTYNHGLTKESMDKVSVRTRTHNVFDVYVYDYREVLNHGEAKFIQKLTPDGAETRIIVNNVDDTEEGNFFTLENTVDQGFDFKTYDWPLINTAPMPNTVQGFLDITGDMLNLGKVVEIEVLPVDLQDNVASRAFGTFRILRAGTYTFELSSRDGSRLFIDDLEIVDNDDGTLGSLQTTEGSVALTAGIYNLDVLFVHRTGVEELSVQYKGPDTLDTYSPVLPFSVATDLEIGSGLGLGSLYDDSLGGGLVGQYNQDPNGTVLQPFGLEGSVGSLGLNEGRFLSGVILTDHASPTVLEGVPTPTTNSLTPVPTFE